MRLYCLDGTYILARNHERAKRLYEQSFGRPPAQWELIKTHREGYVSGPCPLPDLHVIALAARSAVACFVKKRRAAGKTYKQIGRELGIVPSSAFNLELNDATKQVSA